MFSLPALKQYIKCDGVGNYGIGRHANFLEKYIQSMKRDHCGRTLYEMKYITPKHTQIYFIHDDVKWVNFDKVDDIPRLNSWLLSGRYHKFQFCGLTIKNSSNLPQIMHNIIHNGETKSDIMFCLDIGNNIDLKKLGDKYKGYNWIVDKIFVNKDKNINGKLDYVCPHLHNLRRYFEPIIQFNDYDMASSLTILENSNMNTLTNPFHRQFNIYIDKILDASELIQQMRNNINLLNDVYSREKVASNDYIISRYVWNITIGYININDLREIINTQLESKFNHFIYGIENLDMTNNTNGDDVAELKRLCIGYHKSDE